MKIIKSRVFVHTNNLGGLVWNPLVHWTTKYAVFIELEADNGLIGLGECWCFDTKPDSLVAFLKTEVLPSVVGADLMKLPTIQNELRNRAILTARGGILASALSGIDIAMWDLRAQAAEIPLWKCLNPQGSGWIKVYASGGLYESNKDPMALAKELVSYEKRGFRIVKMKIGGLTLKEDITRILTAREQLQDHTALIIDAVYSYTREEALELWTKVSSANVIAFQSPVDAANIEGMQHLCKSGIPVMGIEAEYRIDLLKIMAQTDAVSILQTAPIASGGPSIVKGLCQIAAQKQCYCSLEVSSTAIASFCALQIGAAYSEIEHVEMHQVHNVFHELISFVELSNGSLQLPELPGLGVQLPYDQVELSFSIG